MLTKKIISFALPVFLLIASVLPVQHANAFRPGGWQRLGDKTVNYALDHDVLNVSMRDGRFKQLKFIVRDGSLNMHKCVVHFENGGQQEIDLRKNFLRNSDSRIVDLNGNNRFIEKIDFWYDTKNGSNNKATLVVWGK